MISTKIISQVYESILNARQHVKTNGLAMHRHKWNVIQELSDVHNHRADIDIATKLIKRTKNIFETKIMIFFITC
jgi:N-acetyl-gamma-glutamylphosphate reductase